MHQKQFLVAAFANDCFALDDSYRDSFLCYYKSSHVITGGYSNKKVDIGHGTSSQLKLPGGVGRNDRPPWRGWFLRAALSPTCILQRTFCCYFLYGLATGDDVWAFTHAPSTSTESPHRSQKFSPSPQRACSKTYQCKLF